MKAWQQTQTQLQEKMKMIRYIPNGKWYDLAGVGEASSERYSMAAWEHIAEI